MNKLFSNYLSYFLMMIFSCCAMSYAVKFPMCDDSQMFLWRTGDWGPCISPQGCGIGERERNVTCTDYESREQHDSRCGASAKPNTVEECFKTCDKHKNHLRWVVGKWSACVPTRPLPKTCRSSMMTGIAQREVHCLFHEPYGPTNKVDSSACRTFFKEPASVQTCSLDCPQDCVVANFDTRECGNDSSSYYCQKYRDAFHQRVIVAPEHGGRQCPRLQQDHQYCSAGECDDEREDETGEYYVLKLSKWGPCVPLYKQRVVKNDFFEMSITPKLGMTKRKLTCLNSLAEEVNMSLCRPAVNIDEEQLCLVPQDCELSPWTEWQVLREGCVNSLGQITPEVRVRKRFLTSPAMGNGKPCGRLYERRDVTRNLHPCTKFMWQPLEWGPCVVYTHGPANTIEVHKPSCGGGVHARNMTCIRLSDMVPVNHSYCSDPRPDVLERCEIPCVRDCQVSQWSRWSRCLPGKNMTDMMQPLESGFKKRSRSIVVNPADGGKPCPHLEEMDECWEAELSEWRYGNWSECVLEQPAAKCGTGAMTRDYTCVSWRGERLGEFFCRLHVPRMLTVEDCRIPCPNDCLYTEWSDWSTCSRHCSSGNKGGVMTRNRTILAVTGPGGQPCFGGHKQKEFCNWHSCSLFRWTSLAWGKCIVQDANHSCGEGVQKRQVLCTRGNNTHKDPSLCDNLQKPPDVQICHIPCPQDCKVTEFSEWSMCDKPGCPDGSLQKRERYIVQSAKDGGAPCPEPLVDTRPCDKDDLTVCPAPEKKSFINWVKGQWTRCILPSPGSSCGTGFIMRNVTCLDDDKKIAEIHNCVKFDFDHFDFSYASDGIPVFFQNCQIYCSEGKPSCTVASWARWSHCRNRYRADRYRFRELLGRSYTSKDCKKRFSPRQLENCPFIPFIRNEGAPWTACVLETDTATSSTVNDQVVPHSCGSGYKYRPALLLEGLTPVEPGLERDVCLVDCPIDCLMSDWSAWSKCDVPCGQGYRKRKRTVVIHANEVGRPCPSDLVNGTEIQTEVCGVTCSEFQWLADGWSQCEIESFGISADLPCGNGTQMRTIRCIEKRTDDEVDDSHCDPVHRPIAKRSCTIYCPGDCVVSEWAVWKSCSEPCSPRNHQEERRKILRSPGPEENKCPSLVRRETCLLNRVCFEHEWQVHNWSSCILPEGSICGEGLQKRALVCLRSDGRKVDAKDCGKEMSYSKNPLSKPCYVDCPIDCVVSQWTNWDRSRCTVCGTSTLMKRTRYIIQAPSAAGQPCTSELEQYKSCPYRPCFHWNISDWSECDLQGADCGYGVRRRLVRCFRYDGMPTDKIMCLAANLTFKPQTWLDPKWLTWVQETADEEECHVSCPGDCEVSEWSEWSHCHKDCRGGQSIGYQTSSRIIVKPKSFPNSECEHSLWRTKPCYGFDCIDFRWKYDDNNTLVCERGDGLVVRGACTEGPKPCSPECEVRLGGRCDTSKGLCYCLRPDGRRVPIPDVYSAAPRKCHSIVGGPPKIEMMPKNPSNLTGTTQEIILKYYPDDSQVSIWMYAMISIGTAFVVFVAATMYLMCRSSIRRRMTSVQRQGSVRRRCLQSPKEMAEPNIYT